MTRTLLLALTSAASLLAVPALAVPCDPSDVTFRADPPSNPGHADACWDGPGTGGGGNITAANLTANWGSSATPWFLLDKSDGTSGTVFGVTWTVTYLGGNTGTWQLNWASVGTPGLPLTMDLAVVIKAGTGSAAWLFESEHFLVSPSSSDGTYRISWTNRGGQNPALSHIAVFGRNGRACLPSDCPPDLDVPEPGTLGLLGLGLAGLGLGLRRRRKA